MRKSLILAVLCAAAGAAQPGALERARELYQRTEYRAALDMLNRLPEQTAETLLLQGQCQYMLGNYRDSSGVLERAVALAPEDSRMHLWLGRAYGRRAETSSFLTAPRLASRTRERFERAVALDPGNKAAIGDLFDYYMEAPGILGGGADKAAALAEKFKDTDTAEYHYRLAQLARKRNDLKTTEAQLRLAMEAAPGEVGRVIDLARFLAGQRRYRESDQLFAAAGREHSDNVKLLFEIARTNIETGRNLDAAREMLARFLKSPLTPDDPPRREAEMLLEKLKDRRGRLSHDGTTLPAVLG